MNSPFQTDGFSITHWNESVTIYFGDEESLFGRSYPDQTRKEDTLTIKIPKNFCYPSGSFQERQVLF